MCDKPISVHLSLYNNTLHHQNVTTLLKKEYESEFIQRLLSDGCWYGEINPKFNSAIDFTSINPNNAAFVIDSVDFDYPDGIRAQVRFLNEDLQNRWKAHRNYSRFEPRLIVDSTKFETVKEVKWITIDLFIEEDS